jgi:hypothetical protein
MTTSARLSVASVVAFVLLLGDSIHEYDAPAQVVLATRQGASGGESGSLIAPRRGEDALDVSGRIVRSGPGKPRP